MSKFFRIKTKEQLPKYGLVNEEGEVLLPVKYEFITVEEKGGFVYASLRNEDFTLTEEVYEIKEDGTLECVQESETTDFIWGMNGGIHVLKIEGKIRIIKNLNKSIG